MPSTRRRCGILGCVLLAAVLGFGAPAAAAAPGPSVWVVDSADRVFSSSAQPPHAPHAIELHAARGEQEAAQIAVRAPAGGLSSARVTAGPLAGATGFIPPSAVRIRKEYEHPRITRVGGDVETPPDGGNAYYDALVHPAPAAVPAGRTQPFYFDVRVPAGQRAGTYHGNVVVNTDAGTEIVPVRLRVHDVTLPPTDRQHFQMDNWFTSAGWDYGGTVQAIPLQYGVRMYGPRWWTVIGNIARNMARHRNNVVYADFQALLLPKTTVGAGGRYHFDWSVFDRFVQTFVDAGALQYIYTPTLLEPNPSGTPDLEMLARKDGKTRRVLVPPDTAESNHYLDTVLPALREHLDAKGWTGRFIMSAVDEPSQPGQVSAANWFYAKYRRYFPDGAYNTNEAHNRQQPGIDPNLTTITPISNLYEHNVGYYQNQRLSGKRLWLYTCIGPQGAEMNRFISYHLDETRLLPWLVWKIGGTGYLHWGWNYWFDDQRAPFEKIDTFTAPQTGDNYLVRPDVADLDVYDSLRSEAQLDGIEDYELLTRLAARAPLTARSISQRLIDDPSAYTRDGADVLRAHRAILDALSGAKGVPDAPFRDAFHDGDGAWVHTSGKWSASGGDYTQRDTGAHAAVSAVRKRAWADATVRTTVRIDGGSGWAGVVLHNSNATDADSGYLVGLRPDGTLFVNRAGKTVATAAVPGYPPGASLPLQVRVTGDTVTVSSGGARLLRYTDPVHGFPSGQIALGTGGAAATFGPVSIEPGGDGP